MPSLVEISMRILLYSLQMPEHEVFVCVFVCGMNSSLFLESPSYLMSEVPLSLFHSEGIVVDCTGLLLAPASYMVTLTLNCPCSGPVPACTLPRLLSDALIKRDIFLSEEAPRST